MSKYLNILTAIAKIAAGVALIAYGHVDGGAALIGSGFGNVATGTAIKKATDSLKISE